MKCLNCEKEFIPQSKHKRIYCSEVCCRRMQCKRYHCKYREREKKRKLIYYYKSVSTKEGYKKVKTINYKANVKRRFGSLDRKEFIKKRGSKCEYCGKKDDRMIIHHQDNNGRGKKDPNNDEQNLIICCHSCHSYIHFHKRQMKRKSDTPSNRR